VELKLWIREMISRLGILEGRIAKINRGMEEVGILIESY